MPDRSCFGTQHTVVHDHTRCRYEKLVCAQETRKGERKGHCMVTHRNNYPRGSVYTTIVELGPQDHNGDGLLEPNSIIVVYMDPPGIYGSTHKS